jgi:phospholipid/cholesterol/gamma-HCH transport system permease protein
LPALACAGSVGAMEFIESRREGDGVQLKLKGQWGASAIAAIRTELMSLEALGGSSLQIDSGAATLDLAGAWELDEFVRSSERAGTRVAFLGKEPDLLQVVRKTLSERAHARPAEHVEDGWANPVFLLGRNAVERIDLVKSGFAFLGQVTHMAVGVLGSWRRLRPISIARHVYDTGITAIPIVALIAFLISVIIAYLSASQLRNYGADIYVVDLITVGVLRELGVLLTAIIVAGRTGSAFAAEIGSMKLNEEVDALSATGVDPIETLILPRILGLVIALPLLTFIADVIGLAGGALLCQWLLDMPLQQFISRANEAIAPTTFWAGIIKAPFFAVLIALAGTYRGMQVRGSARELGRLTTAAVVQAIFLVLLADALFAVLFMEIDF